MSNFEQNFVAQGPDGQRVLTFDQNLALATLVGLSESDLKLHRTPVTDMQGDALDAVELEMVNDLVVGDAERALQRNLEDPLILIQEVVSTGESAEVRLSLQNVGSYVSFLNTAYTGASRGMLEGFTIGDSQAGDEGEFLTLPDPTTDQDGFVRTVARFHLMVALDQLMEAWRSMGADERGK